MRELLANGHAETDKGKFTLFYTSPFIKYEPAPKATPDYNMLKELIENYGAEVVNKVPNGGGFWVAGDKNDDMVLDFVKDCKAVNCPFDFVKDSKALKHGSGWCHRVDAMDLPAFEEVFGKIKIASTTPPPTDVMGLIKNSGFEYIDKRANGGSLWIVAGKSEGQELINECKKLGVSFEFTEKGGRASKH